MAPSSGRRRREKRGRKRSSSPENDERKIRLSLGFCAERARKGIKGVSSVRRSWFLSVTNILSS